MNHSRRYSPTTILLCGGAIIMLSLGIRHGFGIFLRPMTLDLQWPRATFAFAIALQNLVWGFSQPFVGMVADRFGAGRVLAVGGLLYAAGLASMAQATTSLELALSTGVLIGLGLSGTYTIVFGVVSRAVLPEKRSLALGLLSGLASFGQFAMLPYGQALISHIGWWWALMVLAINVCLILPLAIPLASARGVSTGTSNVQQSVASALAEARAHRGFWLVTLGFFVCGFQVVFIATHLPAYLLDQGMSVDVGMVALALIGLANIPGSFLAGYLGGRYPKKRLLTGIYTLRAVIIVAFLMAPVSEWSVYLFAIALGLVWLGTVPLTSGIVAQIFGVQYLSMLFGIVYLGHQIGAFLGGWLGGYVFDATGSYLLVWIIAALLSGLAALVNLLADDREVDRRVMSSVPA
ncbi:MFS transporter [Zoogloea dura]|uniref:MFS transporter n=1 Tax=Zoogloea dura TaxID=2728840 RepID=A0A848G776_9RHOO|nr:MFS transporter [Zoogloea dura]NML28118.1 MFS transporter [Zoogloea dura]